MSEVTRDGQFHVATGGPAFRDDSQIDYQAVMRLNRERAARREAEAQARRAMLEERKLDMAIHGFSRTLEFGLSSALMHVEPRRTLVRLGFSDGDDYAEEELTPDEAARLGKALILAAARAGANA